MVTTFANKLAPMMFHTLVSSFSLALPEISNTVSFEIANTHFGLNHALSLLTETPNDLVDIKLNKGNAKQDTYFCLL